MSNTEPGSITDELGDLLRGAGTFGIGQVVQNLAGFLFHWLLTVSLGAALYGVYVYAQLFLSVAGLFADVGAGRSLVRFLPEHEGDDGRRGGYLAIGLLTTMFGGVSFGVVLWVLAPIVTEATLGTPALTRTTRVLAVSLPFLLLVRVLSSAFRGVGRIDGQIALNRIVRPVTKAGVIAVVVVAGATLYRAAVGVLIATVLSAAVGGIMLVRSNDLRPTLSIRRADASEFLRFSVPISVSNVEGVLYSTVDVLMIGWLLTSADVGVYKIALLLGALLVLPLQALNQMFAPLASSLYTADAHADLDSINKVITRWIFSVVLLVAAVMVVYRKPILGLFGPEFVRGHRVLVIVLAGYFVNAAVGPANWLLTMSDRQYYVMLNSWVSAVLNVGLNYVLIGRYGITGAAIATASTLALINVARLVEVWILEGFQPYTTSFAKPLVAGSAVVALLAAVHRIVPGIPGLIVGGIAGTVTYAGCLWLLGIEDGDVRLASEVLKRAGNE